jgi:hypothetical protein
MASYEQSTFLSRGISDAAKLTIFLANYTPFSGQWAATPKKDNSNSNKKSFWLFSGALKTKSSMKN